jgi:transposase
LRHLPLFEVPVYIELRPKRYRCPHCDGTTTTQPLSWYGRRSLHTKAYEHWLLRMLIDSSSPGICVEQAYRYVAH